MNILQINASYKPAYVYGGPTMSVAALSEQLQKAGCQVKVYTTTANGGAELPVNAGKPNMVDGVEVTYFKRLSKDHSHFSPALLHHMWRNVKQFDVVHIHAWWNLVSMGSCLIARLRGVPVVVSPRGTLSTYSFTHKNSYFKKLIHELLGRTLLNRSAIHVTSDYEKKAIKLLLKPRSVDNISNFVTIPAEPPMAITDATQPLRLLFFSRIDAKKGIEVLLEALALLKAPYLLSIAGDGEPAYISQLKQAAKQKGIANQIEWLGFYTGREKFTLMAGNHLLILPSQDENFGNVVIESLSVGTPVVISDKVGLAAYIAKNNLGWICRNDAEELQRTITEALNDVKKRTQIRQHAPKKIRKDFAEDALVKQYIDLYHFVTR